MADSRKGVIWENILWNDVKDVFASWTDGGMMTSAMFDTFAAVYHLKVKTGCYPQRALYRKSRDGYGYISVYAEDTALQLQPIDNVYYQGIIELKFKGGSSTETFEKGSDSFVIAESTIWHVIDLYLQDVGLKILPFGVYQWNGNGYPTMPTDFMLKDDEHNSTQIGATNTSQGNTIVYSYTIYNKVENKSYNLNAKGIWQDISPLSDSPIFGYRIKNKTSPYFGFMTAYAGCYSNFTQVSEIIDDGDYLVYQYDNHYTPENKGALNELYLTHSQTGTLYYYSNGVQVRQLGDISSFIKWENKTITRETNNIEIKLTIPIPKTFLNDAEEPYYQISLDSNWDGAHPLYLVKKESDTLKYRIPFTAAAGDGSYLLKNYYASTFNHYATLTKGSITTSEQKNDDSQISTVDDEIVPLNTHNQQSEQHTFQMTNTRIKNYYVIFNYQDSFNYIEQDFSVNLRGTELALVGFSDFTSLPSSNIIHSNNYSIYFSQSPASSPVTDTEFKNSIVSKVQAIRGQRKTYRAHNQDVVWGYDATFTANVWGVDHSFEVSDGYNYIVIKLG